MNIHDIADAPVDQALRAARSWKDGRTTLQTSVEELRTLGDLPSWSGQASNSMRHRIDSSAHRMHAATVAAGGTAFVLESQARLVTGARAAVRPTLAMADAAGMAVTADGTVVPGGGGGVMGVVSGVAAVVPGSPVSALVAGATAALKAAIALVHTTDNAAGAVIDGFCAVDAAPSPTPVTISAGAVAELVADPDASAAEVFIPDSLQYTLTNAQRTSLQDAVVQARTSLALRGIDPDQVEVTVRDLNGTAAVVAGDLASADRVTTLVSGVGSSEPGKIVGTSATAGRIAGPGHAVIAWHGYQAPSDPVRGALPHHAQFGGQRLRELQGGLRVSTGGKAELQIVAHSYGSTVLGQAASDPSGPLEADVVHLVGSPGVGHDHADDLQLRSRDGSVGEAAVHAWLAPGDLLNVPDGVGAIHGPSPMSPGFGADTLNGGTPQDRGDTLGGWVDGVTDLELWARGETSSHSGYWSDELFLEKVR
ncbi:MAG TPA: alpha/beta hydrolase family protein [Candidatus Corynebacterium avicola]|uniref:Alpha/beta hydrolase family protein n=1 Tax=Candidatus Corynebacterium avicola TaxID=2838527 RepID=A0A9D1RR15_9CORY|nr:alpha/beta hydrolase family protein [Candidatus Corynebacterium avicola]